MAVAIKLPDMGTNVQECKLLTWRVRDGDTVRRGDVLADIETDKAVAELESTAEGVVLKLVVKAGAMAGTGGILAYVGKAGESIDDGVKAEAPGAVSPGAGSAEAAVAVPGGPFTRVSSIVRNLAAKLEVDLSGVKGTGVGGVITREDVQRASRERAATVGAKPAPGEPLPRAQAAVARAVEKSWKEIPHLTITASIDMTSAEAIRTESGCGGARISYDAIFLKAMARAAESFPIVTAMLAGERVVRSQGIHIALAIGIENELYLPVVRDADKKDLSSLHKELAELSEKVKGGSLNVSQMSGGSMALSNLGMYPIDAFDGIIFPEHSTILTVGAIQLQPVVRENEVKIRPRVTVKLAADHRLINGRTAAAFLSKVKEIVESGGIL